MKICLVHDCEKRAEKRGYCSKHAARLMRHGDVNFTKVTPPGEGLAFLERHVASQADECINWPYRIGNDGYGVLRTAYGAHASRAMCFLAHGRPPSDEHHAAHKCGNAKCVNPNHLRWASPLENASDKIGHGTNGSGEQNPRAKITDSDVRDIRASYAKGARQKDIAARYGLNQQSVSNIVRYRTWRSVADVEETIKEWGIIRA